jgi:hypothetical protein
MKTNKFFTIFILTISLMLMLGCVIGVPVATQESGLSVDEQATAVSATLTALALPSGGSEVTAAPDATLEPAFPAPPPALRVVYTDLNGNVWLWTDDGSGSVQLTFTSDANDVRISDDGAVIVFTRVGVSYRTSLWAINYDGTNERQLLSEDFFNSIPHDADSLYVQPYDMEFVPGTHILFYNTQPIYEGPGFFLTNDLRWINVDTLENSEFLAPGSAGKFSISPDGQTIAIITPTQISLINTDGSNIRNAVLTYPSVITYSEGQYYPSPVWSSDSSYMIVTIPPEDPLASANPPTAIWNVNVAGSSTLLCSVNSYGLMAVVPSPDLNSVAYLVQTGAPADNQRVLNIADIDCGAGSGYVTDQLQFRTWFPDSSRMVWVSFSTDQVMYGQWGAGPSILYNGTGGNDITFVDEERYIVTYPDTGSYWTLAIGTVGYGNTIIYSGPSGTSSHFINFDISN